MQVPGNLVRARKSWVAFDQRMLHLASHSTAVSSCDTKIQQPALELQPDAVPWQERWR